MEEFQWLAQSRPLPFFVTSVAFCSICCCWFSAPIRREPFKSVGGLLVCSLDDGQQGSRLDLGPKWGHSRSWRNWQTHQLEGLAGAISCRFKPCRPHSKTKALEARFQGFLFVVTRFSGLKAVVTNDRAPLPHSARSARPSIGAAVGNPDPGNQCSTTKRLPTGFQRSIRSS